MTRDTYLTGLSADQRQALESWLVEFEQAWTEAALAAWVRRLPPAGDPLRRPALLEMVKIDLERRWQAGRRVRLEAYLASLPELGTPETAAADLICAEYEARQQFGPPPDLEEFARRFPRQADAVRQLVGQARSSAAAAAGPRPPETPSERLSAAHDTAPVELPEQFGRYRILKRLGQGGMGAVYLAHDTRLERRVALKVPHFAAADGPEVLARFYREARAAAKLAHPNLCPVHDVGEVAGIPFLTMTYIEGQPMSSYLAGRPPLPPRQAAAVVRKLALALQEAHTRGIVHRDLKPSNVMINLRGEPVIMDFGLAWRVQREDARLTKNGSVLGTPAYMAPEQVRGEVEAMGPACDIYSLGVILYELLTGRLPFPGPPMAVFAQILTQDPPAPSVHRPDLDPQLEAVCRRAMAKTPAERYATMSDLAAALAEYLRAPAPATGAHLFADLAAQGAAASAPPAPPRPRAGRQGRKPRGLWLAAGAAAGALLLGVVLYVSTDQGTVRIELSDAAAPVDVRVDGQTIDVRGLGEPLRFRVGRHELVVMGKDYETVTQAFTVRRGANEPLRVSLVPAERGRAAAVPPPAAGKFEPLFNGKDLTGWTVELQDARVWRVEDGALVVAGNGWNDRSYLVSDKQFASYVLRFELQLGDTEQPEAPAYGGVVIRGIPGETHATGAPSHAVLGFAARRPLSGLLVWARDASTHLLPDQPIPLKPPPEWNQVEVRLHGPALRVTLNGKPALSLNMTQIPERGVTYPGLKRLQGHIGFLKHTGTARYRNIAIQELLTAPDPADIPPSDKVVVPVLRGRRAVVYGREWRIDDAELVQGELAPFRRMYFGDASWTDYDFTFEAKKLHGEDGFAAIVRAADVWNYYLCTFGMWRNSHHMVESLDEATPRVVQNARAEPLEAGRWYRVRVSVRGEKCQCFLDDQLTSEWSGPRHPHGGVGLQTWNTADRFRNLRVTDPDGKVLFEGLPELPTQPGP